MITKKNETKAMTKYISCDCKCKFNSTKCNLKQKWNNKTCQCESKNYCKCKKMQVGILAHVFVRIVFKKYCWYFSAWVWWNYNCYGFCINKKDKYYSNKKDNNIATKYCFNQL